MRVSLFVTCVVDQFFPQVAVAAARVLNRLGVEVGFNADQTCCGQPAFNTGYNHEAREVATATLGLLETELKASDHVVVPSGSCAAMIKKFYSELFADEPALLETANRIAPRVHEFSQFLVDVLGVEQTGASSAGRATYHDACHLLRELRVSDQPRRLLKATEGLEFVEMDRAEACCGFGGTFSVRYPEISTAIVEEKIGSIERSGADMVVACDSSCLMQIAGLLERRGSPVRCVHLAELLDGG